MSFLDRITLLNQLAVNGTESEITELLSLSESSCGDSTIDVMITHTLRDLLLKNETAAVKLLESDRKDHQQLAMGIISRQKFQTAAPGLTSLYARLDDPLFKNELLQTMMDLDAKAFLSIFLIEARNPDSLLAATAIKAISLCQDHSLDEYLRQLIRDNDLPDHYQECAITTAQSIETLTRLNGNDNLAFLCGNLHHKNPTARRFIQENLSALGDDIIPHLAPIFDQSDNDAKILAANLIALTGGKTGGDLLLSIIDQGKAEDHNVRFAVYEALGFFQSMKAFVCLVEALGEPDPLILLSVCTALNRYEFPFVAAKVSERITLDAEQGKRIVSALVDSESENLIRTLFALPAMDSLIGETLVRVRKSRKSEVLDSLCRDLIPADCIDSAEVRVQGPRILAADDSMAIRKFYESILSAEGYQVITAEDGLNAFTQLQFDRFDLLITDLNMPNMDGIELAQKVRGESTMDKMPIIMVTTESEQSQRNLAEKQKINAYVNKPIKPDILLQTIRSLGF